MKQEPQDFSCFLCFAQSIEQKMITASMIRRLKTLMNIWKQKYSSSHIQEEKQSFDQLLRVLFSGQMTRLNNQCRHDKFQRYLLNKLDCSREILYFMCEKLVSQIAERNYQLELVSQQIKNVMQSINQGEVRAQIHKTTPTRLSLKYGKTQQFVLSNKEMKHFQKTQLQKSINQVQSYTKLGTQDQTYPVSSLSLISLQDLNRPIKMELPPQNLLYCYYLTPFPSYADSKQ